MVSSPWVVLLVLVSPIRMDNSSEGSKLPSLLTSLIKTGNYSTHEQVDFYLRQGGEPLAAIRQALCDDPTLWELLDTPLMLNIVTLAYAGEPIAVIQNYDSLEERRRHVFAKYTDQMFKRRS